VIHRVTVYTHVTHAKILKVSWETVVKLAVLVFPAVLAQKVLMEFPVVGATLGLQDVLVHVVQVE